MTEETVTKILVAQARIEEMMKSQDRVLSEILTQAKATNGRVNGHDQTIGKIKEEMAENRGKAKVHGALWGLASSVVLFIIGKLWK